MKKLLLILFICSDVICAQTVLISDIDDTIKITGVKKTSKMFHYGFRVEEFYGSSDLYNYFICNGGDKDCLENKGKGAKNYAIYVTGAPGIIHKLGKSFLEDNNYPFPENIIWKSIRESTLDFKKNIIEDYIKGSPSNNKYILIGDNGEYDPEVYKYITEKYPNKILATFIHIIYHPEGEKHQLLPGQIGYLTSIDLGIHLYNMKMIEGKKLQSLIQAALVEIKKPRNYFLKKWFACKYFEKRNWFPKIEGNWEGLDIFKKSLFEHPRCR